MSRQAVQGRRHGSRFAAAMRCATAALLLAGVAEAWYRAHSNILQRAAVASVGQPARLGLLQTHLSARFQISSFPSPLRSWRDGEQAGASIWTQRGTELRNLRRIWLNESLDVTAEISVEELGLGLALATETLAADRDGDGCCEVLCGGGSSWTVFRVTPKGAELVGAWWEDLRAVPRGRLSGAWARSPRGDYEFRITEVGTGRTACFRWTRPGGTLALQGELPFSLFAFEFPVDEPWRDREDFRYLHVIPQLLAAGAHITSPSSGGVEARWKLLPRSDAQRHERALALPAGASP